MQCQDGHSSTCFNERILVIHILCICLCQLVIIRDLFICAFLFIINRSFTLFVVRIFILFSFSSILCLLIVQKRKKSNSDPEPCSGFSIPLTEEVPVVPATYIHHHRYESINIIQQTPPTLSQYRSEGSITIIDTARQTKPIFSKQTILAEGETVVELYLFKVLEVMYAPATPIRVNMYVFKIVLRCLGTNSNTKRWASLFSSVGGGDAVGHMFAQSQ